MAARKPDFRLKMLHKLTQTSGVVGAGWANDDGSVTVVLDPGAVLDWHDRHEVVLTLFPLDEAKTLSSPPIAPPPPRPR